MTDRFLKAFNFMQQNEVYKQIMECKPVVNIETKRMQTLPREKLLKILRAKQRGGL